MAHVNMHSKNCLHFFCLESSVPNISFKICSKFERNDAKWEEQSCLEAMLHQEKMSMIDVERREKNHFTVGPNDIMFKGEVL